MGRVDTYSEAASVAKARNAVTVYTVLGVVALAAVYWLVRRAEANPATDPEALDAGRFIIGLLFLVLAVNVFVVVGMQRAWTSAWVVGVLVYSLSGLGEVLSFVLRPRMTDVLSVLLAVWVLSRLLDREVVRVFLRVGRRAAPPPVVEEEPWRMPTVQAFPMAQPIVEAPTVPAAPAPSFDYFG